MADLRDVICRRSAFIAPSAQVVTVPDPDLHLDPTGIAFSAGKLTTWTADEGPDVSAVAGLEPIQGATQLNGHEGILFPQIGARAYTAAAIVDALTTSSHTIEIVCWPENADSDGPLRYLIEFWNGSAGDANHLALPVSANVSVAPNQIGVIATGDEFYIDAAPIARPQVYTFSSGDSLIKAYRNQEYLGSVPGPLPATGYSGISLGSSNESDPAAQPLHGAMYEVSVWCDQQLTQAQILYRHGQQLTKYGIDPSDYYPDDSTGSLSLFIDERGKTSNVVVDGFSSVTNFDGTAGSLTLWADQSGSAHHVGQGVDARKPGEGERINGRPTIRSNANQYLTGPLTSLLFGQTVSHTYDYKLPFRWRSLTSTQATADFLRDCIFGDLSGFWGIIAWLQSGVPTIGAYHFNATGSHVLSRTFSLNTPYLAHVKYDGTTLSFQLNDESVQTVVTGPLYDVSNTIGLGRAHADGVAAVADIGGLCIRNAVNTTVDNNDRSYYSRLFGVAV